VWQGIVPVIAGYLARIQCRLVRSMGIGHSMGKGNWHTGADNWILGMAAAEHMLPHRCCFIDYAALKERR
jgi:hypothetical protein